MGTMVRIDDDLLSQARDAASSTEAEAIVEEALRALIARKAARDLIALGGSDPHAGAPPRRRFD